MTRTLLILLLALFSTGCAISQEKEIALGLQSAPKFEQEYGGLYPSATVQKYVSSIGAQLVSQTERPDLPWQFRVLNSSQINAFALPGGFLYITAGLLFNLDNEAQLAAIMGHEIAHVTKRHTAKQIQRQQLFSGGALLAGIFGGSTIGSATQLGSGLILMTYSRGQEKEADLNGLRYLTQAGYYPEAMVETMEKLESLATSKGPPEFLSSHPKTDNREEYLRDAIQKDYSNLASTPRAGREEFAQAVLANQPVNPSRAQPARSRSH